MVIPPDITSRTNPRVKAWRRLRTRSARDHDGRFLIEGEREAMRASHHLHIHESIVRVDRMPVNLPRIVTVGPEVFAAISIRDHPDGIAVVAEAPDHGIEGFDPPQPRLVLVADGIEKPGNLGAMIRTVDAMGGAFLASSPATDLVNPNVVRAAQGSLFGPPIAAADRDVAIAWCRKHTSIVVATPGGDTTPWAVDLAGDVSIVIGSEHAGVDDRWIGVGMPVSLPMSGVADSLNASVVAGVLLAEAVRQRSA